MKRLCLSCFNITDEVGRNRLCLKCENVTIIDFDKDVKARVNLLELNAMKAIQFSGIRVAPSSDKEHKGEFAVWVVGNKSKVKGVHYGDTPTNAIFKALRAEVKARE